MHIKGFFMDNMGRFAVHDLANGVFALLMAALLGYLLASIGGRRSTDVARSHAAWSATAALVLFLAHTELPVALVMLALALIARPAARSTDDGPLFLGVLAMGAACGMGAGLVAVVLALPLILLLRWSVARPDR